MISRKYNVLQSVQRKQIPMLLFAIIVFSAVFSNSVMASIEPDPIGTRLHEYEVTLTSPAISDAERGRLESLHMENSLIATRLALPTHNSATVTAISFHVQTRMVEHTPRPTETPVLGIINSGKFVEIGLPDNMVTTNVWQGFIDGVQTRIYAGVYVPNRIYNGETPTPYPQSRGAISVVTFDGSRVENLRITEDEVGILTIVGETDGQLTLSAFNRTSVSNRTGGDTRSMTFDINDMNFVDQDQVITHPMGGSVVSGYPIPSEPDNTNSYPAPLSVQTVSENESGQSNVLFILFTLALILASGFIYIQISKQTR